MYCFQCRFCNCFSSVFPCDNNVQNPFPKQLRILFMFYSIAKKLPFNAKERQKKTKKLSFGMSQTWRWGEVNRCFRAFTCFGGNKSKMYSNERHTLAQIPEGAVRICTGWVVNARSVYKLNVLLNSLQNRSQCQRKYWSHIIGHAFDVCGLWDCML